MFQSIGKLFHPVPSCRLHSRELAERRKARCEADLIGREIDNGRKLITGLRVEIFSHEPTRWGLYIEACYSDRPEMRCGGGFLPFLRGEPCL